MSLKNHHKSGTKIRIFLKKIKKIKKNVVALKTFVFLQRRYGRAVDRGGLENRYTEMYRGFESLCLR